MLLHRPQVTPHQLLLLHPFSSCLRTLLALPDGLGKALVLFETPQLPGDQLSPGFTLSSWPPQLFLTIQALPSSLGCSDDFPVLETRNRFLHCTCCLPLPARLDFWGHVADHRVCWVMQRQVQLGLGDLELLSDWRHGKHKLAWMAVECCRC